MIMRFILLLGLILVLPSLGEADNYRRCFESYENTIDTNACLMNSLEKMEEQLTRVYEDVLKYLEVKDSDGFQSGGERKTALAAAQERWREFVEADCSAVYENYREGTIRGTKFVLCKIEKTQQRIKELNEWLPKPGR